MGDKMEAPGGPRSI